MLCESCSLDVELLAFHIGAGIIISLWLQGLCRYFCPQSDAMRSDHSLTRNAPKLTYSNLGFQNFSGGETPGFPLKGGRAGEGRVSEGKGIGEGKREG